MGRSYTPTYRVEYRDNTMTRWTTPPHWLTYDSKRHGRPSNAKAEAIRVSLNASFGPDGVNFHVSQAAGVVIHVTKLWIVRQADGEVVGAATAPMFEVV
jgi:hypothetical protein